MIGSVHFVGEASVDQDRWDVWEAGGRRSRPGLGPLLRAARRRRALRALRRPSPIPTSSRSGAPAGPAPERDPRRYWEPAVEAIAEAGVAVEVSTAGLRKPIGELYPAAGVRGALRRGRRPVHALLRRAPARARSAIAYDEAVGFMRELGIDEICVFTGRERRMEPLG